MRKIKELQPYQVFFPVTVIVNFHFSSITPGTSTDADAHADARQHHDVCRPAKLMLDIIVSGVVVSKRTENYEGREEITATFRRGRRRKGDYKEVHSLQLMQGPGYF